MVVVPHPFSPHMYITDTPMNSNEGHRFSPLLTGYVLDSAKIPSGERVVYFKFSKIKPHPAHRILAVEFTGRDSNSCVIDETGSILSVFRKSKRLKPKTLYQPPPSRGFSIFNAPPEKLKSIVPWLINEFLSRYGEFTPQKWREFLENIISNPASVVYCENNIPVIYSPIRLKEFEHMNVCTFDLYSRAVEAYFSENSQDKAEDRVRERIMAEIKRLSEFEKYRKWGEFILSHISEIPEGATEIEIDGEKVRLDVADAPSGAAQHYFKLYRKQKRGIEKLMEKLKELSQTERRRTSSRPEGKQTAPSRPYRVFYSPSGFKILVGKSATGNELVTFGLASDHDLFFHARGVPGAHVILKRDSESINVPEDDIVFAAKLALEHSKASKDGVGDVTYTERKYVKKPKNSPPGLVKLEKEQVIRVSLD